MTTPEPGEVWERYSPNSAVVGDEVPVEVRPGDHVVVLRVSDPHPWFNFFKRKIMMRLDLLTSDGRVVQGAQLPVDMEGWRQR